MQQIEIGKTGIRTTKIGFGCSVIMGSLRRRESSMLLEHAYDSGIRHYDVAPAYGHGEAEACLGEFLRRHRGDVTVTTKYGILPNLRPRWQSAAYAVARSVIRILPVSKSGIARLSRGASKPFEPAAFTPAQARTSLEASLSNLKTDRIEVWLLHEACASQLAGRELLDTMQAFVREGKIACFGVGSTASKIPELLRDRPDYCPVVQFEWSVLEDAPVVPDGHFTIHHRAMSVEFRPLLESLQRDRTLADRWSAEIGRDVRSEGVLASLMLCASIRENPGSITLFSSKCREHISRNVEAAEDSQLGDAAHRFYALMRRERSVIDESGRVKQAFSSGR